MAAGKSLRAEAAARRRAVRLESKKARKQLQPGGKGTKKSVLDELRRERTKTVKAREKRIAELTAKGALYNPGTEEGAEHSKPPFRYDISVKKNVLYYEITLHKIPLDKIKVETTETRIKVDTLAHSKKYLLDMPHPEGVKVNPKTSALAEMSPSGVLSIKLLMTHVPPALVKKDEEKQKSIESVKHLRFRRNQAGELITGTKKVKLAPGLGNKRAAEDDSEGAPEAKKAKKKKVLVTDKEAALRLVESIAQEEEPKKQERKSVLDHVTEMKAERKERRIEKRAKKQTMESQAAKTILKTKKAKAQREMESALKDVKPLKKPTGKRVKFST